LITLDQILRVAPFPIRIYGTSLNLAPTNGDQIGTCEIDFAVVFPQSSGRKSQIVISECKDDGCRIDENDIANLGLVANRLSSQDYEVFVLLSKLSTFSDEEKRSAIKLNDGEQPRVILLERSDLVGRMIYEGRNGAPKLAWPDELARLTKTFFFDDLPPCE